MRRLCAISAVFGLCAGLFLGCARQAPKNADENRQVELDPAKVKIAPPIVKKKLDSAAKNPLASAQQEKYDDALADALAALAQRKWADALEAFEAAQTVQDTEFVQGEIAKLKTRIDQDDLAKNAVRNIETVLNDGNADDAAKLANEALKEFGAGDDAERLIQLRIQAEAIRNAEKKEGMGPRFARLKKEAESALAEKNLRAAALALAQALDVKADADLQKTYDGVRAKVDEYDALRKKGLELRTDPARLDDALEAFQGAAAAWDTLQVRADLDDCRLALAKRRDTIAVADFEVRNDVGIPGAGAAVAEDLLPRLKPKYDLVERGQLLQVLGELKIQQGFVDDFKQQRQIGRLAKARYLVVGSVQRLVGVTIRARLVDTQTGLVVQTAKVVALDMGEALNQMPSLAAQLLMNDEAKMQFEQEVVQQAAKPVEKVAENAALPPAPAPPAANAPPPPPPLANPAPPAFVNVKVNAFNQFAPPPANFAPAPVNPLQGALRNRLLFATIEMGDFLFAAGRFGEANRQFAFALAVAPDNTDIQIRLERCVPFVPPSGAAYVQPRLAVLPFMTYGNPLVVPPTLGSWTPTNLSPYFASRYDVVDPALVYWYMGRVGLTMNDLMVDPDARRWLGRAVGVRYFVLGNLVETTSFDVNTYLLDAELGYLRGSARVNVQNPYELKLRLPEIAELTMMTPAEQAAYLAAAQRQGFVDLVFAGRRHVEQGRFHEAVREYDAALQIYPYDVQVQVLLAQARSQAFFFDLERDRQRQFAAQQAARAAQLQRQRQLAQATEQARLRALAQAAARSETQNRVHVGFRFTAQANLVSRAEVALQTKNFGLSFRFFQGAVGLAPQPVAGGPAPPPAVNYQSFAQARLQAERAEQLRVAQFAAVREATLRQERERQLAAAQKQIIAERAAADARLATERKAQLDHDAIAFNAALKQGLNLRAQKNYQAALAAFQGAQRVAHNQKQNEQVNNFIDIIVQEQAESLATTQDQKAAVEKRLDLERQRRKVAESLAAQNAAKYQSALVAAQTALTAKNFEVAQAKFEEAGQVFKTDAVLTGLHRVQTGLRADSQSANLAKTKTERLGQLLRAGKDALDAKKYGDAVRAFAEAKRIDPDNVDVVAGLTQAEHADARVSAETSRKADDADRVQSFQRLLKSGQASLANKQYEAAVANLTEAVKLNPTDARALASLKQAENAQKAAFAGVKAQAAAKQRSAAYQKLMGTGRLALNNKRYTEAIKAFSDAQKVLPGDTAARDFLADAVDAKRSAEDAAVLSAKQRAAETKRQADLQIALKQGQTALAAKDFTLAAKALAHAQKLGPDSADVKNALHDLDRAQKQAAADAAAELQRHQQFKTMLNAGTTALKAKKYAEAIKALASATALMPNDKDAQVLLRRAQADEALAKTHAAEEQKLVDYQLAMNTGQKSMLAKNYPAAEKAFKHALEVMPKDARATQLLQQAQQAIANAANAQAQRLAGYQKAMTAGQTAMFNKKYQDAINAFQDALQNMPNDPKATQQLQSARQALQNALKGKTPPPKVVPKETPKQHFGQAMSRATAAQNQQKYGDAIKAFQEALSYFPKDADALAGLRKCTFGQHYVQGQQHLDSKMYAEATREFEAALRLFPGNPSATKLLQKAKNKGK